MGNFMLFVVVPGVIAGGVYPPRANQRKLKFFGVRNGICSIIDRTYCSCIEKLFYQKRAVFGFQHVVNKIMIVFYPIAGLYGVNFLAVEADFFKFFISARPKRFPAEISFGCVEFFTFFQINHCSSAHDQSGNDPR